MEIVYDEFDNVRFRLDDGREFKLADLLADLERLEKIDGAMSLVANSREWNRKRVLELEDELERIGRKADPDEVGRFKEENQRLARQVCEFDRDRRTERDRADKAQRRVAELEAALARSINREAELESQNQRLVSEANSSEQSYAQLATDSRRNIAARDSLLAAATTKNRRVREILNDRRVTEAADSVVTSKGAILADAITNALTILSA